MRSTKMKDCKEDVDIDYCESTCDYEGCADLKFCTAYKEAKEKQSPAGDKEVKNGNRN